MINHLDLDLGHGTFDPAPHVVLKWDFFDVLEDIGIISFVEIRLGKIREWSLEKNVAKIFIVIFVEIFGLAVRPPSSHLLAVMHMRNGEADAEEGWSFLGRRIHLGLCPSTIGECIRGKVTPHHRP